MPTATRSAFLDAYGRYAKEASTLHEVRTFTSDGTPVATYTRDEYQALPREERLALQQLDSAAAFIDTEGKSNA